MNRWFRNSWVLVATLSLALLVTQCGSAHANMSPFTETMGENFHLVYCSDADEAIVKLGQRRGELIRLYQRPNATPELQQMLGPKIDLLTNWIIIIHNWQMDNCTNA